jgi:hypothetical protein
MKEYDGQLLNEALAMLQKSIEIFGMPEFLASKESKNTGGEKSTFCL